MNEILTTTHAAVFNARTDDDAEAGTVDGIAVPWDTITDTVGYREKFQRGAIIPAELVGKAVYWNHDRQGLPVGVVKAAEDRAEGLWARVKLADTATGRDLHTLTKDRAVSSFSISFIERDGGTRLEEDGTLVVRTAVEPKELSFAGFPAYTTATIQHVRTQAKEQHTMTETTDTAAELAELRTANDELARRLALVESDSTENRSEPVRFTSLGEVIKGLADRSTTADDVRNIENLYRAAAEDRADTSSGSVIAPGWVHRDIKLVDKGRPLVNFFSREPLPAEGNTVSYPKLGTVTDNTGKQSAEGAALGLVGLTVQPGSAEIGTYGNYASLTRQAIERSNVAYLNKVLTAQKIFYGKATNKVTRDALVNSTGTGTGIDISATNTTAEAWIEAALDAAAKIDADSVGLGAEAWIMSLAHFSIMATIMDADGRPVFAINGDGSNTIGSANLLGFRGNVAGLPVMVDTSLTGLTSYVVSSEAITTLESPGAPFSLNDENVVNLTKDFSLYGYLASTVNDAKGIVKIKTTAA